MIETTLDPVELHTQAVEVEVMELDDVLLRHSGSFLPVLTAPSSYVQI